jgi:hypothetical protein
MRRGESKAKRLKRDGRTRSAPTKATARAEHEDASSAALAPTKFELHVNLKTAKARVFPRLSDKRAWSAVRDAIVPALDAQYGVYVRGNTGDWSFSAELFEGCLARCGIAWPRLETGKLNLQRKTFDSMCKAYPQFEDLRQLRYARDKMRRIKLAVGHDGRNRTVLWPFKAKTSRTQPRVAEWIFFTSRVATVADQAGSRAGRRLNRLQLDGVSDCGGAIRRALRAN